MSEGHNGAGRLTEIMSNRPLIVGALFLGTYFAPFLILIGLPLAYIFRKRPEEDWETSHFQFLIRTFWIALAIALVGGLIALATFALLGGENDPTLLLAAVFVITSGIILAFCGVRIVISLMKSSSRIPISNPKSWLI